MNTLIVLPVSRPDFLPRVFAALELMECDPEITGLLAYVDEGDQLGLWQTTCKFVDASKFVEKSCVIRYHEGDLRNLDLAYRRQRIVAIHNEIRTFSMAKYDYLLLTEDDTVLPPHALTSLQAGFAMHPYAGLVSGVQVGRHGIPHLGLWTTDDVYEPSEIKSMELGQGIQWIDASGLYACLTRTQNYIKHQFKVFGDNDLGPDFEYGLSLRQQGLKNYVDFGVRCEHRIKDEVITVGNTILQQVTMIKQDGKWKRSISG